MRWAVIVAILIALGATAEAKPPGTFVIVIDRSMPVEKLEVVTKTLADALPKLTADRIAVIGAGATASTVVGVQKIDAKKLAPAISRITWTESANLAAALDRASAFVGSVKGARNVLIVTESGALDALEPRTDALRKKGIHVSTLGYQSANDLALHYLAARGEGTGYIAMDSDDLVDAFVSASAGSTDEPSYAVVLVIDRSGSMQGAKLEAAKEAARATAEILAPDDILAVVAFDSEAQVFVRAQRASNKMRISAEISRIQSGGGTNVFPGLKEAFEILVSINSQRKHVIVLTDGDAPIDGIVELVQDMRAAKITVSSVGVQGADRKLLQIIAEAGDGRLYMIDDIGALPRIFMKETGATKRPTARP